MGLSLAHLQQQYGVARGLRESLERRHRALVEEVREQEVEEELLDLVCNLFHKLTDQEVSSSIAAVEKLQNEGLQRVFSDQDITVKSNVEVNRGKVSVTLTTIQKHKNGEVIEGVSNDAFGGSVVTVQSVILRITVLFRRGMRPVMFLDEALPAFDATYVYNMGAFLRGLCDRMGLDLLMVTHIGALADSAKRAYRISNTGGVATFKALAS